MRLVPFAGCFESRVGKIGAPPAIERRTNLCLAFSVAAQMFYEQNSVTGLNNKGLWQSFYIDDNTARRRCSDRRRWAPTGSCSEESGNQDNRKGCEEETSHARYFLC